MLSVDHEMRQSECNESSRTETMSEKRHPDYQDILTENYHLFSRYLYAEDFVPDLISKNVLSPNDKEIVLNHFVNQTRRQRAGKLIDVLLTKGLHGYDCFLEILEFQYPHVYKEVTKKEPRPLPEGATRNRHSDRLLLIESLPNLAHHIKEQFKQNEKLSSQLAVLEGLMKESQTEKLELEKEMETAKSRATEKNRELASFKAQNDKLQADVNKLHEDLKNEMERSHQIRDERDDYKQKVQDLLIERDQSQGQKKQNPRIPTIQGQREQHIVEQNKILKEQLEEQLQQTDEYADRIAHLQDHEAGLERQITKLKNQLLKAEKEMDIIEKEKMELKKKNDMYAERIRQKLGELYSVEDQKREVEDKLREMGKEREIFLEKINDLEEEVQQAQIELERLNLSSNRSSEELSSSPEEEDSLERRRNLKDIYNGKKFKAKLTGQKSTHKMEAENGLPVGQLGSETGADMMKFSTLPMLDRFNSPEAIFQQEVARFRWTLKEKRTKVVEAVSTEVQLPKSIKREACVHNERYVVDRDDFVRNLQPTELVCQRGTPEREPQVPLGVLGSISDKDSTVSSELRPRKPASEPMAVTLRRRDSVSDSDELVRPHGAVRAIYVSTELSDFPSHDVYSVLLPKSCSVVKHKGIQAGSNFLTLTVKLPFLNDKFEITGGNHTGIFVSKVKKNCGIATGDQIKEIIYTQKEQADPLVVSLQGCTLDEAYRLFSEDFIRPKKEKEVKLSLRKSHQEYDSAQKWIVGNGGTGDFFYIRCNYEKKDLIQQQELEETALRPGEIFLVRDTRCDDKIWSGYRINEVTGDRTHKEIRILNKNWTYQEDLLRFRRQLAGVIQKAHYKEEDGDKRHLAFKFKGQVYERVLPMKASVKLPVILFGSEPLVEAMMVLIANNLGMKFTVEKPGDTSDPVCFELYRQDCHSVWKGKLDRISSSQRHIQKIIFLLKITSQDALSSLKCIFGSEFSMTVNEDSIKQNVYLKEKLVEKGLHIEELCFPELTFKETLLSQFQACVQSSQDRILWLSSSEMEPSVAEKYLTYLGPDLSSVMMALQNAQSNDSGTFQN